VFADADLRVGTHINAIGAFTPEMQEIDPTTVARARIFVDSRVAALAEAGDLIQPLRRGLISEASIVGELGEVVAGTRPGRTGAKEITLFKSVGLAVQDAVAAGAILRRAEAEGLGSLIEI
jgi:ornithine cyclodeaminase